MIKKRELVFMLVLSIFIYGCSNQFQPSLPSPKLQLECNTNADCVKVQTSCCSCSMGGQEKCVPATNASAYLPKGCPAPNELFCIALYNCQIKSCECINNKCQVIIN